MAKTINLALQGGGAHGAFTWGVLDAFLEDERLDVVAISGTSAGAMNAVVVADGLAKGGRSQARAQLREFWRAVSLDGGLDGVQRSILNAFLGAMDPFGVGEQMMDAASSLTSPYQLNPLDVNPVRGVLTNQIDFTGLRASEGPKLFIAATNVATGKVKIFSRAELTADMVLASACLPNLFRAVEIDGHHYWDGGYSGNPPLFPFFSETDCSDVVLVQINPIRRAGVPRTPSEIINRISEITFNEPLLAEYRAIDFVARLLDQGLIDAGRYKRVRLHRVDGGAALRAYDASTRKQADYDFFRRLFDLGRETGLAFLRDNFDAIGVRATMDVRPYLE